MMALARAMNASMTVVRLSVQMWSFLNPRLCQELVRSTTQRAPTWIGAGFPLVAIWWSQPSVAMHVRYLLLVTRPRVVKSGAGISSWTEQKWVRGIAHIGAMTETATAWDAAGHVWLDLSLSEDKFFIDATLRVDATPPLEEMALRLGDAVHNFRSAFDSLAWALCHLDGKQPTNPKNVYFPCAPTAKAWTLASKALSSMPKEFLDRIGQVQPFEPTGERALQLLVDLSNQDKHRGMISSEANPSNLNIDLYTGGATGTRNGIVNGTRIEFLHQDMTLVDGVPFARLECSVPVELNFVREPVGLSYRLQVGSNVYDLGDVQASLISLQRVMTFVQEGHYPPAPRLQK